MIIKTTKTYNDKKSRTGMIGAATESNGTEVFKASYDAWGRQTVTNNTFKFYRGYTGHEHLPEFNLINMNGRVYDPVLGRFLSPDPYVQMPDFSQNFNRYSYCFNNPFKYVDPSGEIVWFVPVIIGAVIGAYSGGVMANGGQYNPTKWDYSSGKTWGYMLGGAAIGGVSGYLGASVASGGGFMANTMGIMVGSSFNSMGMATLSGGSLTPSISFGVASYNFGTGKWGYLGKKGNKWYEDVGYGAGALGNLSDAVSLFAGGGKNIYANSEKTPDSDGNKWGHHSLTYKDGKTSKTLVSVGPNSPVTTTDELGNKLSISQIYKNSITGANLDWNTYYGKSGTWTLGLNNVSTNAINSYVSGVTRWDLLLNSCVGHTTRALWSAGVPTLYLFHPHTLNVQLMVRQLGIYSSPYLYQIP